MKKISIFMALSIFITICILFGFNVQANEISLYEKCVEVKNYLYSNLDELQEQYNLNHEEKLSVDEFEGYSLVNILDDDCYGVYIDFNDDNGYVLISFNYEIYKFEVKGDLEYLKNVDFTYYHTLDGFIYQKEDGTYAKYETIDFSNVEITGPGQIDDDGDGLIYDVDAYAAAHYPEASFEEEYLDADTDYFITTNQLETSYYLKSSGGQTYSENNCGQTAIFNVLSSWKYSNKMPNIYYKYQHINVYTTITSDSLYSQYAGKNGYVLNDQFILENMPVVYKVVRNHVVTHYGITPDKGMTMDQAYETISWTAMYYGYPDVEFNRTTTWAGGVQTALKNGKAVFLALFNSTTYSNHAVALLGYKRYTKIVANLDPTYIKLNYYFFVIDDGHTSGTIYFDSGGTSNLVTEYIYF